MVFVVRNLLASVHSTYWMLQLLFVREMISKCYAQSAHSKIWLFWSHELGGLLLSLQRTLTNLESSASISCIESKISAPCDNFDNITARKTPTKRRLFDFMMLQQILLSGSDLFPGLPCEIEFKDRSLRGCLSAKVLRRNVVGVDFGGKIPKFVSQICGNGHYSYLARGGSTIIGVTYIGVAHSFKI